jgi:hypothetical protein
MGRVEARGQDLSAPLKFSVRRVRINSGGYDSGGAYWGTGAPLYYCLSDCMSVEVYLRANDHADAKRKVSERYKNARFYR